MRKQTQKTRRMMMLLTVTLLLVLAMFGERQAVGGAGGAARLTVTSTADDGAPGTLRQAIASAAPGDTIQFDLSGCPCTIKLTAGELTINKHLTISGPGAHLLAISGNHASRVFSIPSGNFNVAISGVTIADGQAVSTGGGIYNLSSGILTVSDSAFTGNLALGPHDGTGGSGRGGAIAHGEDGLPDVGTLQVSGTTFTGNQAVGGNNTTSGSGNGGAIYNFGGTVTVDASTFTDNLAQGGNNSTGEAGKGGAIHNDGDTEDPASLTVTNSTFQNNRAQGTLLGEGTGGNGYGGAIFGVEDAREGGLVTVTVTNCRFLNNMAIAGVNSSGRRALGGAIYGVESSLLGEAIFTITGSTFTNNTASGEPGRTGGGAILLVESAVQNSNFTFDISGCTFSGNSAGSGGAIRILERTFLGSTATINIANSTFTGNSATGSDVEEGGGVIDAGDNFSSSTITANLKSVTISGNTAAAAGGGIFRHPDSAAVFNLQNSIVAGNTAPAGPDVSGAVVSQGNNLIGDSAGAAITNQTASDQVGPAGAPLAAWLLPLGDYGGPTQTMRPLPASPVVDAGSCTHPTDQRGFPRPQGAACDIGAHELSLPTLHPFSGVTRQQGSPATSETIATVSHPEIAPGDLLVSVTTLPNGITLTGLTNSGGQISGNLAATCAAALGANLIGLEVTDSDGAMATATLTVTVTANTPPSLGYAAQNVIVGGTQAFNPSATPGDNGQIVSIALHKVTPAAGMTLTVENSTGHVNITSAMQPGTYTLVIRATDNCGTTTDASFTVTAVCPAISFTPASLPAGQAGVSYSQTFSATPPNGYSYSLQSGSLPSGLTLNPATGVLSGLPAGTGSYGFTIKAQASNGCFGTNAYTLVIGCPTVSLSELPAPTLNTAYNQTVTASPAGGSYSFAVTAGTLPTGLSLNSATGVISGTPAMAGSFNFTITASGFSGGFGGCTGSRSYSFTIGAGGCPAITLPALANGAVGRMYNQSVAASPAGSYGYAVTAGSLPPGLTLYANGLLFGYPTAAGSYSFTITATGAGACAGNRGYSLTIQ